MRQRKIAKPRVHCCGALRIVQRSALLVGWLASETDRERGPNQSARFRDAGAVRQRGLPISKTQVASAQCVMRTAGERVT